jgi:hypothetical protein
MKKDNRFRNMGLTVIVVILELLIFACGMISNEENSKETMAAINATNAAVVENTIQTVTVMAGISPATQTVLALPAQQATYTSIPSPTLTRQPTNTPESQTIKESNKSFEDINIDAVKTLSNDPKDLVDQLENIGLDCEVVEQMHVCSFLPSPEEVIYLDFFTQNREDQISSLGAIAMVPKNAEELAKDFLRLLTTLPLEGVNTRDVIDWNNENISKPVNENSNVYEQQFGNYDFTLTVQYDGDLYAVTLVILLSNSSHE